MSSSLFAVEKHVLPCQHVRHYYRSLANEQEDVLHIAINQYIPLENPIPRPGDVTIIAAHANGVGKELYETLWDELLLHFRVKSSFRIRSVWMADVSFQGESGILNEQKLGNDPSWFDHPRDLLHMINHFRRQMPRPLVGFGHSMGGNNIANLALIHPRLFSSIILIDPVIQRQLTATANIKPMVASAFRRDIWPSRQAAEESFRRNGFFQAWDSRVFDNWVKHGLRDLPTALYPKYPETDKYQSIPNQKSVTLTTTKHQEVVTFARLNPYHASPVVSNPPLPRDVDADVRADPFYRPEANLTFMQLPHLQPRCFFVFAEDSSLSSKEAREDKLQVTGTGAGGSGGVKSNAVDHVIVKKAGHFVPFERPVQTAEFISAWLARDLEHFAENESAENRHWQRLDSRQKFTMEPERLRRVKTMKL